MNDLISRKALCDYALNQKDKSVTPNDIMRFPSAQSEPIKINIDDFNKEDLERFKKELGNTPITVLPAQPEIIRCKDCKFASGDSRICMKFGHSPIDELDFCSWAERKTDE